MALEIPAGQFTINVVPTDGTTEVFLAGELDVVSCEHLLDAEAIASGSSTIVDMRDVTFIDSTALRSLWLLHQRCRAGGGQLVLRAPSRAVVRVLEISGLRKAFTLVDA